MDNKKFYWIKLKTDFFNQDTIDFLLSQKNGCEYIVLYQMLCLKTANNGGKLTTNVGEIIIPYDIDKIVRDCKYFDTDTVMVALELFKKLNLIYQEEDKILKITDFDEMVGSECSSAKRVREWREKKKVLQCNNNVTQEIEIRDKSIDKDIDLDKDIDINNNNYNKYNEFVTKNWQTLTPFEYETLKNYCSSRGEDIVILAIQEAIKNKKKTLKYVEGILKNWKNNNLNTIEEIEENNINKKPFKENAKEKIERYLKQNE